MTIIQKVKKFVESECRKPTSKYGYGPFRYHLPAVVKYAQKLADELGGDREIIIIAAWLHDIGSIIKGRKDHHLTGAQIAEKKLKEFDFPRERIEKVKECIISHRGSQKIKPKTLEAQILVEADTISAFNDLSGLFECAYLYEKLSRPKAQESVKRKLENKWQQLRFKKSKDLVRPKYKAAILLLK